MAHLFRAIQDNQLETTENILHESLTNINILNIFAIYVASAEEVGNQAIKNALQAFAAQFVSETEENSSSKQNCEFLDDSIVLPELDINRCLAYLATDNNLDELKELLEAGLSTDIVDTEGKCLLHHAAAADSEKCVTLLLNHNAMVDDAQDLQHITPLMMACRNGSVQSFQLLLDCTNNVNHHDLCHQSALHYACKNGSIECVQGLMERNIELKKSLMNETELMVALSHNSENVIQMLMDYGADVHVSNRMGYTVLHYTAKYNCPSAAELLCQANVDQGRKDRHGYTALAVAAKNGHIDVLNAFLKFLPDKQLLEKETKSHVRAIDLAAMMGHCDCVEALLLAGADMSIKRSIVYATQGGHKDVLELLISTYKLQSCNAWYLGGLEIVDNFGMSPLHIAAVYGHVDCVSLLVNEGANPCQAMISTAETPLMLACRKDYHEVVSVLVKAILEDHSKCGLNQMTSNLKTALHYAASLGAGKCASILLEAGAVPDIRDAFGSTPLVLAVEKGHCHIVKLLLEATPVILNTSRRERSSILGDNAWVHRNGPAMLAAKHGKCDILKLILDNGANITCSDHDGITLLHMASRFNNSECVELLIERGANVNACNLMSQTPLNLAVIQGSHASLGCLVFYNANLTNLDISTVCFSSPFYPHMLIFLWRVGCCVIDPSVRALSSLNAEHILEQSPILLDIISNPASLMMLCRANIRANMPCGIQFRNRLQELPIPTKLRHYIGMERDECDIASIST